MNRQTHFVIFIALACAAFPLAHTLAAPPESESKDTVKVLAAESLSAEPNNLEITVDKTYGDRCGILVSDGGSSNKFTSAYVSQTPSKDGKTLKTFAGFPFSLGALEAWNLREVDLSSKTSRDRRS
jgi:hypothetical protein